MSFEPRIVRPDPDTAALSFDDELSALAEQLSSEAADLARQYPVREPKPQPLGRPTVKRSLAWRGVAALLVAGATISGAVRWQRTTAVPLAALAANETGELTEEAAGGDAAGLLFQDLSDSEREGLLDLWENGALGDWYVSL